MYNTLIPCTLRANGGVISPTSIPPELRIRIYELSVDASIISRFELKLAHEANSVTAMFLALTQLANTDTYQVWPSEPDTLRLRRTVIINKAHVLISEIAEYLPHHNTPSK